MKLSDIMGHSGLSAYAEVAMILFLIAFLAIVVRIFWPSRKDKLEAQRNLPLDDEHVMQSREGAHK